MTDVATHLERAKAKVASARNEPCDAATSYLCDAIDSMILAQEAIALILNRPKTQSDPHDWCDDVGQR